MKYQRFEDLLQQLKFDDSIIKPREDWPAYIDYSAIDIIIFNTPDDDIDMVVNGSFICVRSAESSLIIIRAFLELIRHMREYFYHKDYEAPCIIFPPDDVDKSDNS